jgi:uncharacterized protein YcfJ
MIKFTLIAAGLTLLAPTAALAHHDSHRDGWYASKHEQLSERHERKAERHYRKAKKHIRLARKNERQSLRAATHAAHWGRVVSVQPVYRDCRKHRSGHSCVRWVEERDYRNDNWMPTIAGGVLGGALGYSIGEINGAPVVGTVAGGMLGAVAGHSIGAHVYNNQSTRVVRYSRHHSHHGYDATPVKYLVSYRYRGQVFSEYMDHHPGDKVRLELGV